MKFCPVQKILEKGVFEVTTKLHLLNHPILQHKLALLRDKNSSAALFRQVIYEISMLISYEATRDLKTRPETIETPLGAASIEQIIEYPIVVAIMRAGNAMLDGVLEVLPTAKVGHIGIYRDRFVHNTVEYYLRLPKETKERSVLLLDPILATGDTMLATIGRLKEFGVGSIAVVCILASTSGIERIHAAYPDVNIYVVAIESQFTEQGFLIPGIGDVSNRLYGTVNEQ